MTHKKTKSPARFPRFDYRELKGPFDIIGDIHGCFSELCALLAKLGYRVRKSDDPNHRFGYEVEPPRGRMVLFVGDFVDRGPASPKVLRLAMSMVEAGTALAVIGNHDDKFYRYLKGNRVKLQHGLEKTVAQMSQEPPEFWAEVRKFLESLPHHCVLDGGRLILAHAGLRERWHYRSSKSVRALCMYGETRDEVDEKGLPVRKNWGKTYTGSALVVYGHTPVEDPVWQNNTVNIDTGCVYGNKLTALRYPELELVSVKAAKVWSVSSYPRTSWPRWR
ncbi:MAG: protein phosphatase [Bacteroidetes bacterium]|nr:MAG: protein phosphatase [Bacteroidota bacterium]